MMRRFRAVVPAQGTRGSQPVWRVALQARSSNSETLPLEPEALRYFDVGARAWRLVPGTYELRVGGSSADLPLRAALDVPGGSEMELGG